MEKFDNFIRYREQKDDNDTIPVPSISFCIACRVRTIFIFLNGWEKSKEDCFRADENYFKFSVHK